MMKTRVIFLCAALLLVTSAVADPPPRPLETFDSAKRVARDVIYAGQHTEFYCGCAFVPTETRSGGTIDASECGYVPRRNKARGKVLEWEHVVPAYYFGHQRTCWRKGNAKCVRSDGKAFKGRQCCSRVDKAFRRTEADLHNLTPAVGEINGDRSNLPYGEVAGEASDYGKCDFKIGGKPRIAEPRNEVKGDAARIWLYMSETYGIELTEARREMFDRWTIEDPPDDWERFRDVRIEAAQGNKNAFVR